MSEQKRRMIISVAGGFNTLLVHPPLPLEIFADMAPPQFVGTDKPTVVAYKQYDDLYTGIQYSQEVQLFSTVRPAQYGKEVCAYLGKAGVEVEFDEHIYGASPETLVMLTNEAPVIEIVQPHSDYV